MDHTHVEMDHLKYFLEQTNSRILYFSKKKYG